MSGFCAAGTIDIHVRLIYSLRVHLLYYFVPVKIQRSRLVQYTYPLIVCLLQSVFRLFLTSAERRYITIYAQLYVHHITCIFRLYLELMYLDTSDTTSAGR